jgi:predicted phage tail protein
MSASGERSTGPHVTLTVKLKLAERFPQESTAAHITPVVPTGKKLFEGIAQSNVGVTPLLSNATTWYATFAPPGTFAYVVMFGAELMTGGEVSCVLKPLFMETVISPP